jgi:hypothetical protein
VFVLRILTSNQNKSFYLGVPSGKHCEWEMDNRNILKLFRGLAVITVKTALAFVNFSHVSME